MLLRESLGWELQGPMNWKLLPHVKHRNKRYSTIEATRFPKERKRRRKPLGEAAIQELQLEIFPLSSIR